MSIRRMLVLGGGSDIAVAFAQRCIGEGLDRIVLAGRAGGSVDAAAAAMLAEHPDVKVDVAGFDGAAVSTHAKALAAIDEAHGPFDTVVVAFGQLGDPFTLDIEPGAAAALAHVNYSGAISSCLASIGILRGEANARLVVLSSIAAVRPRIDNIVYSSAKAGLDAFLTEITPAASEVGVDVVIVRPGFVHSRMTDGLEPAPFATTPDVVADDMYDGIVAGKKVIHSPNVLAPVGKVLKTLPGPIWRRISSR